MHSRNRPKFEALWQAAAQKGLEIVVTTPNSGPTKCLRIETRDPKDKKVIDHESVKRSETTEIAAERLMRRLKKARVV